MIRVCGMQVHPPRPSLGFCDLGGGFRSEVRRPVRLTLEIEVSPEGADLLSRVTAESIALGCGLDGLAKVLDEARWTAGEKR